MREFLLLRKRGGRQASLSPLETALCGAISGSVNAVVVTPVELVRNNLMTDVKRRFAGPLAVVQYVLKRHGLLALWKGLTATVVRDGIGT
eukprot:3822822-Prorocentrum_lima.AAC.1